MGATRDAIGWEWTLRSGCGRKRRMVALNCRIESDDNTNLSTPVVANFDSSRAGLPMSHGNVS